MRPEPSQVDLSGNHIVVLWPRAAAVRAAAIQVMDRVFLGLLPGALPGARRLVVVDEPAMVMLELHRGAESVVLLDGQPEAMSELLVAAARYHPQVPVFFAVIDAQSRRLAWRRVQPGDAGADHNRAQSPMANSQPAAADDALKSPAWVAPPAAFQPAAAPGESSALLTEEEVAMLMAPLGEAT